MEVEIVWLVKAAWITVWIISILPLVIASIPSSKLNSFRELVLSFAGRGKILHPSSQVFVKIFELVLFLIIECGKGLKHF